MDLENKKHQEGSIKIETPVKLEKESSLEEQKSNLKTEMNDSVKEFKARDGEVRKIEGSVNVSNVDEVRKIKEELALEENLKDLDAQAENLKQQIENDIEQKSVIMPGVEKVFELNPELEVVGSKEQYSEYLETIFPDTQLKEILYHGTTELESLKGKGFLKERLTRSPGFNFIHDYDKAEGIALAQWELTGREGVVPVVLNAKNIQINDWDESATQEKKGDIDALIVKNTPEKSDYYVVFEPSQIHILGSKTDIESFKAFVAK